MAYGTKKGSSKGKGTKKGNKVCVTHDKGGRFATPVEIAAFSV